MKTKEKQEIKERLAFLQIYTDFNNWLDKHGFKTPTRLVSTPLDFHYSEYNKIIDDLYSVEHYVNDTLKISLRFLRDTNKHVFLLVGAMGTHSDLIEIGEFKELIKNEIISVRDEKLAELKKYDWV